mgnify:CR=1 FL=1
MYRAGIWDGKWTGKDGKTGKRDLGSKNGKVGRDTTSFVTIADSYSTKFY